VVSLTPLDDLEVESIDRDLSASANFQTSTVLISVLSPFMSKTIVEEIVRDFLSADQIAVDFLVVVLNTIFTHSFPSGVNLSVVLNYSPDCLTIVLSTYMLFPS